MIAASAPHVSRHAQPKSQHLKRFRDAMAVKIPKTVDQALDLLGRHPLVTSSAAGTALAVVLAFWRPTALLVIVVGVLCLFLGGSWRQSKISRLETERDDLLRDNAAKDAELTRIRGGDASAATRPIRPIEEWNR